MVLILLAVFAILFIHLIPMIWGFTFNFKNLNILYIGLAFAMFVIKAKF